MLNYMLLLFVLLTFANLVLLVLNSCLLFEIISASLDKNHYKSNTSKSIGNKLSPSTVVLIPAHNEEAIIHDTLTELQKQLGNTDKLIVVSDNCTDATSDIARATGATVIERINPQKRGKGYALECGLKAIAEQQPPDIVIIVDADCLISTDDGLLKLAEKALAYRRPVQAVYLLEPPSNPSIKDRISVFAFKIKNLVRPLGLARFNLGCPLTGTGMAFPWEIISTAELASSELVEDMKLGLDLSIAQAPPILCPEVTVIGKLPKRSSASTTQRTRWEHGHLKIIQKYVPKLLCKAFIKKQPKLLVTALDTAIPPLSFLVTIWTLISFFSFALIRIHSHYLPGALAILSGTIMLIAILAAWINFGYDDLKITHLILFPFYLLWKIPIYLKYLIKPQQKWIRTERDK